MVFLAETSFPSLAQAQAYNWSGLSVGMQAGFAEPKDGISDTWKHGVSAHVVKVGLSYKFLIIAESPTSRHSQPFPFQREPRFSWAASRVLLPRLQVLQCKGSLLVRGLATIG